MWLWDKRVATLVHERQNHVTSQTYIQRMQPEFNDEKPATRGCGLSSPTPSRAAVCFAHLINNQNVPICLSYIPPDMCLVTICRLLLKYISFVIDSSSISPITVGLYCNIEIRIFQDCLFRQDKVFFPEISFFPWLCEFFISLLFCLYATHNPPPPPYSPPGFGQFYFYFPLLSCKISDIF